MGCLERAGFAAGSDCGSTSGICSDGTSKSAISVVLPEHLLHRPLHFPGQHQFQMRRAGRRHFRETQFAPGLRLGAFDGQQGDGSHRWQSDFPGSKPFQLRFDVGFSEQIRSDLGRVVDDDIIHAVAREIKQFEQIVHALGVLAWKQEEREANALRGQRFEQLQRVQRLHDEAVGLRPAINDVNRRVIARHVAKQTEQGGFAFVITAEFVGLHLFGMAVGKGMVSVIEVGAVPVDVVIIEPCGSKFSLETFAEAAFGLGIDVDAFGNVGVHVKLSV